jgi:hypothetical protein
MKLLVTGWYQVYEIECEQHYDELDKLRLEHERQEASKHDQLLAIIERGECDDN